MSKVMRQRKRPYYKGTLAEPMEFLLPILPTGKLPEPAADWSTRQVEIWRAAVDRARQEDARNFWIGARLSLDQLVALCDDFGINRSRPGWSRDLALSLARRHEPDFMRGTCVSYAELFARYGIDPDQPDSDFDLALALARQHVPGMRLEPSEPPRGRLSTIDFIQFTLAVVNVSEHLRQSIGSSSDRNVVKILIDPIQLKRIIPTTLAAVVTRIIQSSGNGGRFAAGPLSDTALRSYLRQMRTAWNDYCEDRATTFQQQFVLEVLPFISRASRTANREPGQI